MMQESLFMSYLKLPAFNKLVLKVPVEGEENRRQDVGDREYILQPWK